MKALQIAAKNGTPLHSINRTNIDSLLRTLTISARDKADIQNAVNAGKEVTVSRDNITLGDWTGIGYIARDPNTGAGAYMISNELGGGGTVKASNPKFDLEQKLAFLVVGTPIPEKYVKLSDVPGQLYNYVREWNIFLTMDVEVAILVFMPMWGHFGYTSDFRYLWAGGKKMLLEVANHPDTWIFYYVGHGGQDIDTKAPFYDPMYPKDSDVLVPNMDHTTYPYEPEVVYPSEIHADAKIVFLNACTSGLKGSFIGSFGIGNGHKGDPRDEAFLGWMKPESALLSGFVGFEFWGLMGMKIDPAMSVNESVDAMKTADKKPNFFNLNDLFIKGGNTTLVP